jgi:hypothetical protein
MTTEDTCWTIAVAACCGSENGRSPVLISLRSPSQGASVISRKPSTLHGRWSGDAENKPSRQRKMSNDFSIEKRYVTF